MSPKAHHRSESFCVFAVLHEPTRGLWAKVDPNSEEQGRDEGRSKLEAPGDVTNIFDYDVGAEAQEDACERHSVSAFSAIGIEQSYRRRPRVART